MVRCGGKTILLHVRNSIHETMQICLSSLFEPLLCIICDLWRLILYISQKNKTTTTNQRSRITQHQQQKERERERSKETERPRSTEKLVACNSLLSLSLYVSLISHTHTHAHTYIRITSFLILANVSVLFVFIKFVYANFAAAENSLSSYPASNSCLSNFGLSLSLSLATTIERLLQTYIMCCHGKNFSFEY